jgi:hypothetical protein
LQFFAVLWLFSAVLCGSWRFFAVVLQYYAVLCSSFAALLQITAKGLQKKCKEPHSTAEQLQRTAKNRKEPQKTAKGPQRTAKNCKEP